MWRREKREEEDKTEFETLRTEVHFIGCISSLTSQSPDSVINMLQRVASKALTLTSRAGSRARASAGNVPALGVLDVASFSTAPAAKGAARRERLPAREDGHERHNKVKGIKSKYDKGLNVHLAIEEVKANAWARFDEGVDIALQLNVDPRKPNQNIRGIAKLPHGSGRNVRVAVFATGSAAAEALDAGADIVGSDELLASIQKGNLDFDALIATPEMMGMVGKLGRILGPRGLMPNPKLGTVTKQVGDAVKSSKAGAIQFRVEKKGIIHAGIGRVSFSEEKIAENIRSLMTSIADSKPEGLKGSFFAKASLSSSMGPGVPVELTSVDPSSTKFMLTTEELL